MSPNFYRSLVLFSSAALALGATAPLSGCMAQPSGPTDSPETDPPPGPSSPSPVGPDGGVPPGGEGQPDGGNPGAGPDPTSRSPSIKRKDGEQLSSDLAQALELDRSEVCRELGLYDCAREAHRIVLGGVEPYRLRIDVPLSGVGVSAPIAADRVALSACAARARLDLDGGGAPVVFGPLAEGAPDGRARVVDALYDRLLGRAPDPEERALLAGWTEEGMTDRDFAILSCFVVATTLEHLFY